MTRTSYKLKVGGQSRCRCSACGESFSGLKAFDQHRVGDWSNRRCWDLSDGDSIPSNKEGWNFEIKETKRGTFWTLVKPDA